MAIILGILRIVVPLLIIFLLARFLLPRYLRSRQQQSDRINVDATVVNSEQNKVNDDDIKQYEPSKTSSSPSGSSDKNGA